MNTLTPSTPRRARRWTLLRPAWLAGGALLMALWALLAALALHERRQAAARAEAHAAALERVVARLAELRIGAASRAAAAVAGAFSRGEAGVESALRQATAEGPALRALALLDEAGTVLAAADAADAGLQLPRARWAGATPLPEAGAERLGPPVAADNLRQLALAAPPSGRAGARALLRGLDLPDGRRAWVLALVELAGARDEAAALMPAAEAAASPSSSGTPLLAAGAGCALLVGLATLAAERTLRASALGRERARQRTRSLATLLGSVQALVFRTDAQGRIDFANPRLLALAGPDVMGRTLRDIVIAPDRDAARALFAAGRPGDGAREQRLTCIAADGRPRHLEVSVQPLLDEAGRLVGHAGSALDVSERVLAQERLQAQGSFNRMLMEVSPLPATVVDLQRRCVLVNRAWEDFTGRSREPLLGRPLPGGDDEAELDRNVLRDGRALRHEARLRHRDGSLRDVVIDKLLVPGEEGRPAGVLTVFVDVTEFRRAERATREAREAAEEAARARTEFIANISHELRTPLQAITGFSELGGAPGRAEPRLAAMFHDIHAAGRRMLALVDDLLDVARVESPLGTLHLERADLRVLLREALDAATPQCERRGLHTALDLPEQPLRARLDPQRMRQVLDKVLANAIRLSPAGGTITVAGELTPGGELHLSVADEGPGIPAAELETIFEPFVQGSRTKDGSGGTGLGLAICRQIVAAHGGRIHATHREGKGDGGGAVFHIHLPARAASETKPSAL